MTPRPSRRSFDDACRRSDPARAAEALWSSMRMARDYRARAELPDLVREGDIVIANDAATLPASLSGVHCRRALPWSCGSPDERRSSPRRPTIHGNCVRRGRLSHADRAAITPARPAAGRHAPARTTKRGCRARARTSTPGRGTSATRSRRYGKASRVMGGRSTRISRNHSRLGIPGRGSWASRSRSSRRRRASSRLERDRLTWCTRCAVCHPDPRGGILHRPATRNSIDACRSTSRITSRHQRRPR